MLSSFAQAQGKYFSIATGYTSFNRLDLSPLTLVDEKNFTTKFVWGYSDCVNAILCIGPEIGFGYFGESTWQQNQEHLTLTSTGFDVSVLWSINLHQQFYGLFKIGTVYHLLFIDDEPKTRSQKGRIDSWMPTLSIGLGYRLSNKFHIEGRFEGGLNEAIDYEDIKAGRRRSPSLALFLVNMQFHY